MEPEEGNDRARQNHEAIDLMINTMRQHHRVVERRIDGLGVHHSQHRLLMCLSRMGKIPSQKEIAQKLDVSPACVARMLKGLSGSGLIDKAEGSDGRCNEISILPRGTELIADSLNVFREIDAEMFSGFSDEEIGTLITLMRRVRKNLTDIEQRI